jgi:hypothetical protein
MRLSHRIPRRFRPYSDALEPMAPASSLVPTLTATSSSRLTEAKGADANHDFVGRPSRLPINDEATTALADHFSLARSKIIVSMSTNLASPATASASARAQRLDTYPAFANSQITLTSAPADSMPVMPATVGQPRQATGAMPASGAVLTPTGTGSVPIGQATATTNSSALSATGPIGGVIRPMTLSPSPTGGSTGAPRNVSALGSGNGANAGSGSGGNGGGASGFGPPTILGNVPISGTKPNYTVGTPDGSLPIGAVPSFAVSGGSFATVEWSGGTTVGSYLSGSPVQPGPHAQGPPTSPVPTNQTGYSFIVQAETPGSTGFQYDVSATVTYANDPTKTKYTSHVKFTSDPPSVASLSVDHMAPKWDNSINTLDNTLNLLFQIAGDGQRAHTGIAINASTQTHHWGGTFMILQVIDSGSEDFLQDQDGDIFYQPTVGDLANLDSGQPLAYRGINWHQSANATLVTNTTYSDSPALEGIPRNYKMAKVSRSYDTYLMFMPDIVPGSVPAAVWVALSRVHWSIGETYNVQTLSASGVVATNSVSSAVGFWPTWSAWTTDPNPASTSNPKTRWLLYSGPNPF